MVLIRGYCLNEMGVVLIRRSVVLFFSFLRSRAFQVEAVKKIRSKGMLPVSVIEDSIR